jgi:hypothetical protein
MSIKFTRQRLTQAVLAALALGLLAPCSASASPQETIERAGPPVPTPQTRPCEVQLFRAAPFATPATGFSFTPPVGCPAPWAKVVLSMDLDGSRAAQTRGVAVALNDVTLFLGPTPDTAQPSNWHVERDLTDYSVLFEQPGHGTLTALRAFRDSTRAANQVVGSATLRFYPVGPGQRPPRVPDAVFPTDTTLVPASPSAPRDLSSLPHNIERAYLDVTAEDAPFWYNCFTPAVAQAHPTLISPVALGLGQRGVFPAQQGCVLHSYSDVLVTVDGSPAGVAPVFPWLPTHFSINSGPRRSPFWNAVDTPTDSAQSLDYEPYRVDLSPFAAVLNEAGSHQVALNMPERLGIDGQWFLAPRTANLLVYLDHGRSRLPGAVTFNSLPAELPQPVVTDGLVQDGDLLQGRIGTKLDRNFEIRGYVDTSHGRVQSVLTQQSRFWNVRQFHVKDDPADFEDAPYYREDLWLKSTTQSVSRHTQGGRLLGEDRWQASYPLEMHYIGAGRLTDWYSEEGSLDVDLFGGSVNVHQQRQLDVSHFRHDLPRYTTRLREEFYGNHRVDPDTDADSVWHAAHAFAFHDNRGSCYQKAVTTRDGLLDDTTSGIGCPGGANRVRWYAHPDGSPDGWSWQRP